MSCVCHVVASWSWGLRLVASTIKKLNRVGAMVREVLPGCLNVNAAVGSMLQLATPALSIVVEPASIGVIDH